MIELPEQLRALSGRIEAVIYLAAAGERGARRPLFISDATRLIFGLEPAQLTGEDELLLAHVHPEDLPRLRAELEVAAGTPYAPLKYRLIHQDGRVLWCRETMVAVESADVPAGLVAGVVADVSELELPRQALEASLSAQGSRGAMLALCDVLAQALALSHTVFVDVGTGERQLTTHGPLGRRLQARWDQPLAIEPWAAQVAHEDRFASVSDGAESLLSAELRALCPGARLGFAIPVAGDGNASGQATGALLGLAPRALALHPMHRRMLEALGRQAGLSLQRAGLVEALQRTGRERQLLADALVRAHEEERGRLARELHDGAGQTLTAAAIQLDLAERRSNAEARPAIAAARKQVEQTLEELRRLAHALRPAALDGLGLGEALAEMARSLQGGAAGGLEVRVEVPGALPALDPQISTALFRVAQAALTNVVRHARASRATLRLQVTGSEQGAGAGAHQRERALVALEVIDDGRGFVPGGLQQQRGGMGLVAMRERTVALGGRFSLWSEPGGGAQVRAEFDV